MDIIWKGMIGATTRNFTSSAMRRTLRRRLGRRVRVRVRVREEGGGGREGVLVEKQKCIQQMLTQE